MVIVSRDGISLYPAGAQLVPTEVKADGRDQPLSATMTMTIANMNTMTNDFYTNFPKKFSTLDLPAQCCTVMLMFRCIGDFAAAHAKVDGSGSGSRSGVEKKSTRPKWFKT